MRRHTAIPVKTSAVAVLIMTGAVYMAAEARQSVTRKQQREISRIENSLFTPSLLTPSSLTPPSSRPQIVESIASVPGVADVPAIASRPQSAEVAAERQAARIPAQMPASANDSHRRQIVISIPDRRLALLEDGKLVKSYPIAVGARVSPSPDGEFAVINHARNPTYRHAGKEILPGKDNPLGTRWIGLSLKGYGIHGTNVPSSIGKAASHGCFRMGQADVEDLYTRVQVGDTVTVRRERDELIAQVFVLANPGAKPASPRTETEVAANSGPTTEAAE